MSKCPYCDKDDTLFVEEVYSCGNCGLEHKNRDMPYAFALHERIDRLTAELTALREQVRWIPVSERFPEDRTNCLAVYRHKDKISIMTMEYVTHEKVGEYCWIDDGGDAAGKESVTHWMPLPQPPEGE